MQSNVAQLPLHDKVWGWFETNKKQAIYGTAAIVVVGLIVGFVIWQRSENQIAAGNALSNVAATQLDGTGVRSGTADAYLKIAAEYPRSSAGSRALLLAAASYFTDSKYSEAQAQFDRFIREYPTSTFTGEALLGVAACLEAEGKTEQAVAAYKDLVTRHPNATVIPQAKFGLARMYEAQNKPEQARTLYEEVVRAAQFTSFGNEAGVRLEELNTKFPVPTPAPVAASTNATSIQITNLPLQIK
jgi:TolA-binding protein